MNIETIVIITAMAGVIIGLAKVLEKVGVPKKWLPLADMVLGIPLAFIFFAGQGWAICILTGIVAGLQACGLFSGIKNVTQQIKS